MHKGPGSESWMRSMMLLPRSVWVGDTGQAPNKGVPGLCCCADCSMSGIDHHVGRSTTCCCPEKAIANGYWIHEALPELQDLNPLELALASMAQIEN